MPANVYECMFLLDTNKVAGNLDTADKQLHAILEKNHCRGAGQPAVGRTQALLPDQATTRRACIT